MFHPISNKLCAAGAGDILSYDFNKEVFYVTRNNVVMNLGTVLNPVYEIKCYLPSKDELSDEKLNQMSAIFKLFSNAAGFTTTRILEFSGGIYKEQLC